jgi:L-ascorbate metabolism protein UlaG (beta-lactamase superfamily)
MRIEYVGHSTVLVDLDGVRLVTDPLLRNRIAHLRRTVPVDATALRGVDAILISHAHYDHLDLPSLEKVGKKMPVVLPRGLGGLLRRRRFESVVEVEVDEILRIGALEVRVVPAEHPTGRLPRRTAGSVGYLVTGSRSVYFAGDTDLFDGMAALGSLDVALLPVWGWGPLVGRGHLDPARAAHALTLLRPRLVVPIHWGTYFPIQRGLRGVPSFLEPPPMQFVAAARQRAPEVDVRILRPGESLELPATGRREAALPG